MKGDALLVHILAVALFASLFAVTVMAGEEPIQLKQVTGLDKVETNCGGCHSLDYVIMNSPFPTGAVWEAEVNKMVKAFGAPIEEPDAKTIVEYLKNNYGK